MRVSISHTDMAVTIYREWFITFGWNQLGGTRRNKYTVVIAASRDQAQKAAYARYGNNWSMLYDDDQFRGQVGRFNLSQHEVIDARYLIQREP